MFSFGSVPQPQIALDFEERGFPKESVFVVWGRVNGLMNGVEGQVDVALVEVCCEQDSALNVETSKGRILCWCCSQCSVWWCVETSRQHCKGLWVHVHASSPCSSGKSPLNRFSQDVVTISDVEWESIMTSISGYLALGNSRSFELPFFSNFGSEPYQASVTRRMIRMNQ